MKNNESNLTKRRGMVKSMAIRNPTNAIDGEEPGSKLLKKAKLSIFKAVFVPILTYCHESWVMTERMRSQVQASEMRFLRRIEGVTLFNKVRSSEIRKSLNIKPLLLRIKRSQL